MCIADSGMDSVEEQHLNPRELQLQHSVFLENFGDYSNALVLKRKKKVLIWKKQPVDIIEREVYKTV